MQEIPRKTRFPSPLIKVVMLRCAVVIGAIVLGVLAASWLVARMPDVYESMATIEVRPIGPVFEEGVYEASPGEFLPPAAFMRMQLEAIKSRDFLLGVVDRMGLDERWGMDREAAYQVLRRTVRVSQISGTDLIRVSARLNDPQETRDVVAEVAHGFEAYREKVNQEIESSWAHVQRREQLREEVAAMTEEVEALRATMAQHMARSPQLPEAEEAKAAFEARQRELQQLRLRFIGDTLGGPGNAPTIILHDEPVVSDHRVAPNPPLIRMLGGVSGLLIGLVMSIFVGLRRAPACGRLAP